MIEKPTLPNLISNNNTFLKEIWSIDLKHVSKQSLEVLTSALQMHEDPTSYNHCQYLDNPVALQHTSQHSDGVL